MHVFKFIDLFSGIGGMRMAFESVGGECVLSCDNDKFARKTYEANFNVTEEFAYDIRSLELDLVPHYDVLLAGFPCQPFSYAGQSKNGSLGRDTGFLDQTRGTLFFNVAEMIKYHRPMVFLLENVKGLLSHDKGRTFATIWNVLSELGYHLDFEVLSAEAFVPQKRERVFIVGHRLRDIKLAGLDNIPGPAPTLRSILEDNVDDKYTLSDKMVACLERHKLEQEAKGNGFGYGLHGPNDVARTLLARYYKDGSEILIRQDGKNPRRLTPRECARLMGFPDSFQIVVSDTQAYKQFGNSVVVPLVSTIARSVAQTLGKQKKLTIDDIIPEPLGRNFPLIEDRRYPIHANQITVNPARAVPIEEFVPQALDQWDVEADVATDHTGTFLNQLREWRADEEVGAAF